MIVCDSSTLLYVLLNQLELTPESLITTPGQLYNLIVRLRWCAQDRPPQPGDELHQFLEYQRQLNKDRFTELLQSLDDMTVPPNPAMLQVADSASLISPAADLAIAYDLKSDGAFLFALVLEVHGSLLFTKYHADKAHYAQVAEDLGVQIEFIDSIPQPMDPQLRIHDPRRDRRRPVRRGGLVSVN